ncbi:hypothetical protein D3C78_733720 [compost metagenome]
MVDPVRDRLTDADGRRQIDQPRADVAGDLIHRAGQLRGRLEADIQLADVHTLGVLIQLRAAAAAADVGHFRHLHDQLLGLLGQRRGLRQGHTGVQTQADQQGALVERRQEGLREERHARRRDQHGDATCDYSRLRTLQDGLQAAAIAALEPGQQLGVAMLQRLHLRQQIEGQHRGDGH